MQERKRKAILVVGQKREGKTEPHKFNHEFLYMAGHRLQLSKIIFSKI